LATKSKKFKSPPVQRIPPRHPVSLPRHIVAPHPLPIELWECVITFLRADGRSHAKLSVVSRTMRAMVLPYYFQSVTLTGRLPIEMFLEAYEGSLPQECPVRSLLLTGSTYAVEGISELRESARPLMYLPFSALYHRLLRLLAPSLVHLTVMYPLYRAYGHTHLLPHITFPRLRVFIAQAEAFNRHLDSNREDPLPYIPSLKRMFLFGSSLDHGSFDILSHIAPELEELRIVQLSGNEHYTNQVGLLLGMDQYTSIPYEPSQRRIREVGLRLSRSSLGGSHWLFDSLSTDRNLFDRPPVLHHLRSIFLNQLPPADLEEITNRYTGPIQLVISPLQPYDDRAALADWQDIVLGGKGAWAVYIEGG
jgi:hypothetical protein